MNILPDLKVTNLQATNGALTDTIRTAFYHENPSLFELLNYEDDFTFLEPSLFCYFLSDISKTDIIPLLQSVVGYIPDEKRLAMISLTADRFGMINLPNLGYIRTEPYNIVPVDLITLTGLIPDQFVKNSKIRLCLHPTDLLAYAKDVSFHEPVEDTLYKNEDALSVATTFLQKQLPNFWSLIASVTREFVVFSSPNHNSFAGIMHHGTAYFNTENKIQTPVFFY